MARTALRFRRLQLRFGAMLGTVLVATSLWAAPPKVDDATRNAAREMARDAVAAYDAGEYEKALDLLQRAHDLVPAPTITLYQARCLSRLGRLVEAMERYEATRHAVLEPKAPKAFRDAVKEATRELEEVRERVPKAKIVVKGPGEDSSFLQVKLDGKPVPRALVGVARTIDPGTHHVEARVPGVSRGVTTLNIDEKQVEDVVVRLNLLGATNAEADETSPAADSEPRSTGSLRTWGYVGIGVGVVGVAVGATGALMANGKKSDLDGQCDGSRCPPSAQDDLDAFRSARTLSLVGYGVGIVGLVAGSVLLLWPEKSTRESARVTPWVSLGQAGVGGRF